MATIGRVVVGPGEPKNVVVRTSNRTTISSPNFNPKVNVAITDIQGANVEFRRNGDALIYDATRGEYVSSPLTNASLEIGEIRGGRF